MLSNHPGSIVKSTGKVPEFDVGRCPYVERVQRLISVVNDSLIH